jgi:hypothetical protein
MSIHKVQASAFALSVSFENEYLPQPKYGNITIQCISTQEEAVPNVPQLCRDTPEKKHICDCTNVRPSSEYAVRILTNKNKYTSAVVNLINEETSTATFITSLLLFKSLFQIWIWFIF